MQVVRDKVVSNLATSLEKAAAELKKEGHVEGLPDATAVARAVEQALQTAFSMSNSCFKAHGVFPSVTTCDVSCTYCWLQRTRLESADLSLACHTLHQLEHCYAADDCLSHLTL